MEKTRLDGMLERMGFGPELKALRFMGATPSLVRETFIELIDPSNSDGWIPDIQLYLNRELYMGLQLRRSWDFIGCSYNRDRGILENRQRLVDRGLISKYQALHFDPKKDFRLYGSKSKTRRNYNVIIDYFCPETGGEPTFLQLRKKHNIRDYRTVSKIIKRTQFERFFGQLGRGYDPNDYLFGRDNDERKIHLLPTSGRFKSDLYNGILGKISKDKKEI